jgi:hypothetical protein
MSTDQQKILPPPYMSYGVFKSTIDALAEATVPTGALDRRVLDGLSGADHGALMSGLKFLGYVDDDRKPTNVYRQLVEASKNPQQFKESLLEVVNDKYAAVIGNVNIQTGTIAELEKAFKAYGVPPGQMLTKTIRFYLKALAECGFPVSPHITKAKPRTPRNGSKKTEKAIPKGSGMHSTKEHTTPKGFERMPVPGLPDAFVQFPLNLTEAHCDLFDSVVRVLRTFAKGRSGGKENVA